MLTISSSAFSQVSQQNETRTNGTMADTHDEAELIKLLRGNRTMQDKALVYIMSHMRDNIIGHLCKKGCLTEKAEAYFLEGLTKVLLNVENENFTGEGSIEGYLKTICRNTWLTALRSEKASKAREEIIGYTITTAEVSADDLVFYEQRAILLKEILQNMGAGCSEIMLLKAEGYSAKEIVEMTTYTTVNSVNKRHSVCMEKVRTLMKNRPHIMKLLKELHEK